MRKIWALGGVSNFKFHKTGPIEFLSNIYNWVHTCKLEPILPLTGLAIQTSKGSFIYAQIHFIKSHCQQVYLCRLQSTGSQAKTKGSFRDVH